MKRAITILFSFIYLMTASGILVGQHLCMGRVQHSAIFEKPASDCGMDMEMEHDTDGCCDDEWVLQKIEDDQQISALESLPKASYYFLYEVARHDWLPALSNHSVNKETRNTGPPDRSAPDLTILYHSLKIPLL